MSESLPQARIETRRGFSLIWLVPIIAALIGGWLIIKTQQNKGPTVTLSFSNAEGLEAGKTRVKYKDVVVGKVREIELGDKLDQVLVSVELSKSIGKHLNDNTRFWVVRPRINSSGVRGLTTLISGIYIGMDPASGSGSPSAFAGLEQPPQFETAADGTTVTLRAKTLGSLDTGSPVYFRQIQVGQITRYELDQQGRSVKIKAFISAPYHQFVRSSSRFWNASGFSIDFNANGVNARLESLAAFVSGGIAFDTPLDSAATKPVGEQDIFPLHEDYASINEKPYEQTQYYVMNFDSSLRGLSRGAPVEFRGIKVGEVLEISLKMNHETLKIHTPVLVGLQPGRVTLSGTIEDSINVMAVLVERGLRAQLKSGNLLTGQLYIDLEFLDDAPAAHLAKIEGQTDFPTVPATLDKITRNASELFDKFGEIPLLEISNDLRDTLKGISKLVNSRASTQSLNDLSGLLANARTFSGQLNGQLSPQLNASLAQLESTLATMENIIGEDSPLYYDLRKMIEELSSSATSFEHLTDYLERHPNSLLLGKQAPD